LQQLGAIVFLIGRGGHGWLETAGRSTRLGLNQADFNRLVVDHGPAMFRMAYRMVGDRHEAEDLVQEAFRSAWKSRLTFQAGRGERAWLASILRRRVVDRWRRNEPHLVSPGDAPLEIGVAGATSAAETYTDEMQNALSQLPRDLRETLLLVVVAELTHQETADLLGIPLGTVLSRVSRARLRLREILLAAVK
jgi:RNA polymerase sigma-70 factor (ECF subfamily)